MNLSGKNILLGVTGGIAAYKSAYLLREFQKAGAEVRVTMTPSATRFVGSETFAALSRHKVAIDVFNETDPDDSWTRHIHWGEWADIFIVVPCTANTLAKLVYGLSDNMLTSVALAVRCPLLLCPTMDAEMMNHPAVKKNLDLAADMGFHLLAPDSGYLASGLEGNGRLPDPEKILQKASDMLEILPAMKAGTNLGNSPGTAKTDAARSGAGVSDFITSAGRPLSKKKILVTAGPTREHIDPVRFISNPSSGKMGIAMAAAARNLGGIVTLLHGPVSTEIPAGIESDAFVTAEELFDLIQIHSDADVVIMAAAVSDFRPAEQAQQKIKKTEDGYTLPLTASTDSLEWLGKQKKEGQILIGFAMETENLEKNALGKLKKKNLDWICANDLTSANSGFQSDSNHILLFGRDSQGEHIREEFTGDKQSISEEILTRIFTPAAKD